MSDLIANVTAWLKKTGYPLEMRAAQRLREAGFGVVQSEYFEDPESGKWRESDVVAYEEHRSATCRALFALVVECKGRRDKPWILFSHPDKYPDSLFISRRATSEAGASILNVLALKDEAKELEIFQVPDRTGYGVTIGPRETSSGDDYSYGALQSVCKSAMGIVRRLSSVSSEHLIPFAWPVVVIDAPLLEAYLRADGELEVAERSKGLLIWRNPMFSRHTLVTIYTVDAFLKEVENLREEAKRFMELAAAENDRSPRDQSAG